MSFKPVAPLGARTDQLKYLRRRSDK